MDMTIRATDTTQEQVFNGRTNIDGTAGTPTHQCQPGFFD
jgi:hypothetical protein